MTRLEELAIAYAKAKNEYTDAYNAWCKAHPDEFKLEEHIDLPSWRDEVHAQCVASNAAMYALLSEALRFASSGHGSTREEKKP